MNGEEARQGLPGTAVITRIHSTPELGEYGGELAQRCPDCNHVSPSATHLEEHQIYKCCGALGRAA
ncbi:MAG: hypothetical protein H0X39_12045 [Actinobacteria bacterium]|nr:hypothetical protein [Actinomycetota bacterium]